MEHILNHTQSYNFDWPKSLNDYTLQKRNLQWGSNPPNRYITKQMIHNSDNIFNPILQTYNNNTREQNSRKAEQSTIINAISKNYDNRLKTEQTFNVITLEDRLKGFEKHPDYPIQKNEIPMRKILCPYHLNYNVVSNLPLSEHHYDKPENRPREEISAPQKKLNSYKIKQKRDYDIISTKYNKFHEEKTQVDKEINKFLSAKKFYQQNNYNIIKGRYFDESKENEFLKQRDEMSKTWGIEYKKNLPSYAKGQCDLYNILNMQTVNGDELKKADLKDSNKKKRFKIREKIENFYHDQSMIDVNKKEKTIGQKFSYHRYKEADARQYNIIDLKDIPYKQHANNVKRDNLTDWEKIVSKAGDNNTFKTKSIYKDMYDYSEGGINYDKFRRERNNKLQILPKIDNDSVFRGRVAYKSKINEKKVDETISKRERMKEYDKEKFFKGKKNVDYKDNNFNSITHNVEMSKKTDTFEANREKNMRFKGNDVRQLEPEI